MTSGDLEAKLAFWAITQIAPMMRPAAPLLPQGALLFGLGGRESRPKQDGDLTLRFDLVNVALAAAVVLLVMQAFSFIDLIRQVLVILVLAILLATGIEPLVIRLRRGGISRGPSVLGIYLIIVGLLVGFLIIAGRTVSEQASSLTSDLPALAERLSRLASGLPEGPIRNLAVSAVDNLQPERIGGLVASVFTAESISQVVTVTLTVFETVFTLFTVFVIGYFWIAERPIIRRLVVRSFRSEQRERVLVIWQDVEQRLGAWVRGQLVLMLIIGTAQGIGYAVVGLPFALLLAVFAGLMEAIPMVGPYLGAVPALLIALAVSPQTALILAGYTVLIHLVESNVLVPRVMEQAVGLTPLSIILALLVGSTVGGFIGALLAIPIAAAAQAAIVDLIDTTDADKPVAEEGVLKDEKNAA